MRAAVYRRFGGPDLVRVEELPRPSVGADDVLIRVHASTVSAADHRARSRDVPRGLGLLAAFGIGAFRPKRRVLGMDVAGVVEAAGADTASLSTTAASLVAVRDFTFHLVRASWPRGTPPCSAASCIAPAWVRPSSR